MMILKNVENFPCHNYVNRFGMYEILIFFSYTSSISCVLTHFLLMNQKIVYFSIILSAHYLCTTSKVLFDLLT